MARWPATETPKPLNFRDLTRIDNKINPQSVIGWRMVGHAYRNGRKIPGYTHLLLSGGGYVYYPEDVAIGPALDDAANRGYDVTEARAKLQRWIETGEGVDFKLSR